MKKTVLLATFAVAILVAPVTFAQGGKPQGPKEKASIGIEKKEMKKEQKVADNAKKHHHKKVKKEA